MKRTWGVCTHTLGPKHVEYLNRCVASIRQFYPKDKIVVISSKNDYRHRVKEICDSTDAIFHEEYENINYEAGAWKYILDHHESDYWCFIQDSCWLNRPLEFDDATNFWNRNLTFYGIFEGYVNATVQKVQIVKSLAGTKWENCFHDNFAMCEGNMIFCKDKVIKKLYSNGYFEYLPTNKGWSMNFERRMGLCLCLEGYEDQIRQYTLKNKNIINKTFAKRD
ncbi:MAG: hypothetical protein VW683_00025 [Betaproteobacteria bacterium]|jgi:hypothetical protein